MTRLLHECIVALLANKDRTIALERYGGRCGLQLPSDTWISFDSVIDQCIRASDPRSDFYEARNTVPEPFIVWKSVVYLCPPSKSSTPRPSQSQTPHQ